MIDVEKAVRYALATPVFIVFVAIAIVGLLCLALGGACLGLIKRILGPYVDVEVDNEP